MRRFLCAIKELRSNSSAQKMWRRKNAQRAQARLGFFVARAAEGGEAHTDLLGDVFLLYYISQFISTYLVSSDIIFTLQISLKLKFISTELF
jgi:hypothetical protein